MKIRVKHGKQETCLSRLEMVLLLLLLLLLNRPVGHAAFVCLPAHILDTAASEMGY